MQGRSASAWAQLGETSRTRHGRDRRPIRFAPRRIGRTKGGLNSKLHAVCDGQDRPRAPLLTEGQGGDHKGAAAMPPAMPAAPVLIADRCYDADRFRQALRQRGTRPCIPGRAGRSRPIRRGRRLHRQRHKIESMFGRLNDRRRVATRYDRCAHTSMSAIALAATMLSWPPTSPEPGFGCELLPDHDVDFCDGRR